MFARPKTSTPPAKRSPSPSRPATGTKKTPPSIPEASPTHAPPSSPVQKTRSTPPGGPGLTPPSPPATRTRTIARATPPGWPALTPPPSPASRTRTITRTTDEQALAAIIDEKHRALRRTITQETTPSKPVDSQTLATDPAAKAKDEPAVEVKVPRTEVSDSLKLDVATINRRLELFDVLSGNFYCEALTNPETPTDPKVVQAKPYGTCKNIVLMHRDKTEGTLTKIGFVGYTFITDTNINRELDVIEINWILLNKGFEDKGFEELLVLMVLYDGIVHERNRAYIFYNSKPDSHLVTSFYRKLDCTKVSGKYLASYQCLNLQDTFKNHGPELYRLAITQIMTSQREFEVAFIRAGLENM